jgi:FkbH-like protein
LTPTLSRVYNAREKRDECFWPNFPMSTNPTVDLIACMNEPLNAETVLLKRRQLKRSLSATPGKIPVRIAILGGSTTADIRSMMELFLLQGGLEPSFYESEYNQYFEDVLFENPKLKAFQPDVVYVCTTWQNIGSFPALDASTQEIEAALNAESERFRTLWREIARQYGCIILQNNFDLPALRPLGNLDGVTPSGRAAYIHRLNVEVASQSQQDPRFQVIDIEYLSAKLGLDHWFDPDYWFSYKMALTPPAAVQLGRTVANVIQSLYGKAKKCLVLDLDNTLWGGVIGDDGVSNLKLGRETALGESFVAFQLYVKELARRGVLLAVCSKNNHEIAEQGFSHPDSVLKLADFSAFYANWEPKHENIAGIARKLNIGLDSLVFVDDNPAERALVSAQLPMVAVPNVGSEVSRFASILEAHGYFEPVRISQDDTQRGKYYQDNARREEASAAFQDYGAFLDSLEMTAEIAPFSSVYLDRIAQLTNKTNQFNLTTRRYTFAEIERFAHDPSYITLYGRLVDKFGDNGIISLVIACTSGSEARVDLWLMSCRVLKRDMEQAMCDALVDECQARGITRLTGEYIPTAKNGMVAGHYQTLGFQQVAAAPDGVTRWLFEVTPVYQPQNKHISRRTAV